MPSLELFDETLDINSTENYEMSLEMSQDGFSFCILDTIRNKYILIRSFVPDDDKYFSADQVGEIISKDDFLTRRYKKINIVAPSSKYTLVPSALFDPGKKEEYFTFNQVLQESEVILNNRINDPDSYLVFSISKPLQELISKFYPGVHPLHQLKPLIEHISHHKKSAGEYYISIHIDKSFFNLLIYKNDALTFSNAFNYRNISDILYFILKVFDNLGIKQEQSVFLSGQVARYDDLFSNLSLYIRTVKFAEPTGGFTFSYVFNDTELHRYINLLNAVNCV
jgi:hypothetical protein